MKNEEKAVISHDIKCDLCENPATHNIQSQYNEYSIDNDGEYWLKTEWEGDTNEHYCDECYDKR